MYSLGDLLIELISCVYVYVLGSKHRSATNPTSNSLQFIYFDIFFCSNLFNSCTFFSVHYVSFSFKKSGCSRATAFPFQPNQMFYIKIAHNHIRECNKIHFHLCCSLHSEFIFGRFRARWQPTKRKMACS